MTQPHLPRSLVILLFILVAVTFFVGTLRAFTPAHAVSNATATPTSTLVLKTPSATLAGSESETPVSTPTVQVDNEESLTPTPAPDKTVYADTTGIIALSILLVVVMLVGMIWGGRSPRKKSEPKK